MIKKYNFHDLHYKNCKTNINNFKCEEKIIEPKVLKNMLDLTDITTGNKERQK